MRLTRRALLGGAAAGALAGTGIYELIDRLAAAPQRQAAASRPPEQHLLEGIRVVSDGVEVLVPPLHHQVVTARLRVGENAADLSDAREELEQALAKLDARFDPTPAGLGVTVAWGLPYFRRYVPGQAARHLPIDRRATAARGRPVRVLEDAIRFPSRRIGHSGSIQPTSRLGRDVVGPDGTRYPKGTAVPQRADFNTLDNPFFWTATPRRDSFDPWPAAGLNFVVFNPASDDFRRNRLAMDGVLPDGTTLPFESSSAGQGFNQVLLTTHRQNFLVPPRRHRSFPLSELPG